LPPVFLTFSLSCETGLGKDDIKPGIEHVKHPDKPLKHRGVSGSNHICRRDRWVKRQLFKSLAGHIDSDICVCRRFIQPVFKQALSTFQVIVYVSEMFLGITFQIIDKYSEQLSTNLWIKHQIHDASLTIWPNW
jgi:hypothetical protein